jgi:4-amino-4-deoxy-L-arabinose transferase-like glycosyltransferase
VREGVARRGALLLVLVACCLPLFIGLGDSDLGNDEAIYSYAAESILITGDWLSPRSSPNLHIIFLEKPPLKFWIVAAPIRLGLLPLDEFGLRFWDALFGSAAFVYVFLLGRRMGGALSGLFAVLTLFVHRPLIFEHGLRSNNMEAALLLAYCGGVYHFLRWAHADADRRRRLHIAAFTAFLFLAFMTKFVAAVFLPLVCGLMALLLTSGRSALLRDWRKWTVAALVFVALVAPWFVYHAIQHFEDLWATMFRDHVVTRFTAYVDPSHLQPWHYYFSQMIVEFGRTFVVWWVAAGLCLLVIDVVRTRKPELLIVLIWALLPPVLISLGSSKVYHYLYPFLPPFALAAGYAAWRLYCSLDRVVVWLMSSVGRSGQRRPWPTAVRGAGVVILVLALAVTVATLLVGPFRIEPVDGLVFRNHAIGRPLIIAAIGLVLAGGSESWLGAALAIVVIGAWLPTPLLSYTEIVQQLGVSKRPIATLSECIRTVHRGQQRRGETVRGVYAPVSHEAFLHPYFFYLRGNAWHSEPNDEVLREALFVPGRERAVAIDPLRYRDFLSRHTEHTEPAAVALDSVIVALPGPFERCAGTPSRRWP